MENIFLVIPLLASTVPLAACDGSVVNAVSKAGSSSFKDGIKIGTSAVDPGAFEGVTLAGPDDIVFTTADNYSIRAEGDDEALEQLRYRINSDGQMKIGRDRAGKIWDGKTGRATVYISAPGLKNAKLAGSGNMEVDQMTGDSTSLSIAGSGNITVAKVETASLSAKIAGSGDMMLTGTADKAKISVAGSGDLSGKGFAADTAKITIAGSGNVALSSDGSVDASVAGSGDVQVSGKAKCKSRSAGSGKISCG